MAASCTSYSSVAAHLGYKKPEPGCHGNQLCYSMDGEGQRHAAMARVQVGGAVPMFFPTYGILGNPLRPHSTMIYCAEIWGGICTDLGVRSVGFPKSLAGLP